MKYLPMCICYCGIRVSFCPKTMESANLRSVPRNADVLDYMLDRYDKIRSFGWILNSAKISQNNMFLYSSSYHSPR